MKILETQSAVLTNYEVLTHLTATAAKPRSTPQKHSNVNTILKEVRNLPPSTSAPTPIPIPIPISFKPILTPPPTSS